MNIGDVSIEIVMCALSDYDEDGHLQIQTDSPGLDGNEGTHPAEALAPGGIIGRPLDPDKSGEKGDIGLGAPGLLITVGDVRYIIPLLDPRDVATNKIPKVKKGGRMLAGGAGDHRSFVAIDGEDPNGSKKAGSITIMASYNKAGQKKSLGLSMNVRDEGDEDISVVHGNGQRITLKDKGVVVANAGGDAYFECGEDGNVLAGSTKVQGSMTVGNQMAAMPVPIWPKLFAYLQALEAAVLKGNVGGPIAITVPLASVTKLIEAQNLKAT